MIPLESSTYGTIHGVYDRLLAADGHIVGETQQYPQAHSNTHPFAICDHMLAGEIAIIEAHCLCSRPGVTEDMLTEVVGHPHIIESCSQYLDAMDQRRGTRVSKKHLKEGSDHAGVERSGPPSDAGNGSGDSVRFCVRSAACDR